MPSYLERYEAGAYEEVWSELRHLGEAITHDAVLLADASAVAHATMVRVSYNIDILITRLRRISYTFAAGGGPRRKPSPSCARHIHEIETRVGSMPLALKAWLTTIGSVNLTGSLPSTHAEAQRWSTEPLPDPLMVAYPISFFRAEYREWNAFLAEEGPEVTGPFLLNFAPDAYHKADISGGEPYGIALPNAAADAYVEHEWHTTTFVSYVRESLRWGGFPGFSRSTDYPKAIIASLTAELLPF